MKRLTAPGERISLGLYNKLKYPLIPLGMFKDSRWEVLENDRYKSFGTQSHRACLVRCTCPEKTGAIRTYGELRCGRSPSCGCISRERSIETVWKQLHNALSRRGWDFHLTVAQLRDVVKLPCSYCGKEPSNVFRLKYKVDGKYRRGVDPSMEIRWSGLDRVDSMLGYIYGNVVPCCGECNGMKSNLSLNEFYALIERIRSHGSTVEGVRALAATLSELWSGEEEASPFPSSRLDATLQL
jgi:hypothetical protein